MTIEEINKQVTDSINSTCADLIKLYGTGDLGPGINSDITSALAEKLGTLNPLYNYIKDSKVK